MRWAIGQVEGGGGGWDQKEKGAATTLAMLPGLGDPDPGEECRAVVRPGGQHGVVDGGGLPSAGEVRRDATLGESQLSIEILLLHQWSPLTRQISLLLLRSFLLKGDGPRKEVD